MHASYGVIYSVVHVCIEYITSMCTGHQRSEGRRHHEKEYLEDRKKKLGDQQFQNVRSTERGVIERLGGSQAQILDRVRVYIDGYLDNMTDIEMKRIVASAGGRIMLVSPFSFPFSHRTSLS